MIVGNLHHDGSLIFCILPLFNFSRIESLRSPCFSTFMLCGVFMMVILYKIIKIIYDIIHYKTCDRYGYLDILIFLFLVKELLSNHINLKNFLSKSPHLCFCFYVCWQVYVECCFCVQHCCRCSSPRCT